jgi:hypothetical protein
LGLREREREKEKEKEIKTKREKEREFGVYCFVQKKCWGRRDFKFWFGTTVLSVGSEPKLE